MTVPPDGTPKRLLQQLPPADRHVPTGIRPLGGASPDAMRVMIETLVQERLETEFAKFIGVAPYDRDGERGGVRNGSRPRTLVTRVGTLTLRVPRDRDALFQPTVF